MLGSQPEFPVAQLMSLFMTSPALFLISEIGHSYEGAQQGHAVLQALLGKQALTGS